MNESRDDAPRKWHDEEDTEDLCAPFRPPGDPDIDPPDDPDGDAPDATDAEDSGGAEDAETADAEDW